MIHTLRFSDQRKSQDMQQLLGKALSTPLGEHKRAKQDHNVAMDEINRLIRKAVNAA